MQRYPGMEGKEVMATRHGQRKPSGLSAASYLSVDKQRAFARPHRWRYGCTYRPAYWHDGIEPPYDALRWHERAALDGMAAA